MTDERRPLALSSVEGLRTMEHAHPVSGVYFLSSGDEVVYVGKSVSVYGRVPAHHDTKEYDSSRFIPVDRSKLTKVESAFIRLMKPRYNKLPGNAEMEDKIALEFLDSEGLISGTLNLKKQPKSLGKPKRTKRDRRLDPPPFINNRLEINHRQLQKLTSREAHMIISWSHVLCGWFETENGDEEITLQARWCGDHVYDRHISGRIRKGFDFLLGRYYVNAKERVSRERIEQDLELLSKLMVYRKGGKAWEPLVTSWEVRKGVCEQMAKDYASHIRFQMETHGCDVSASVDRYKSDALTVIIRGPLRDLFSGDMESALSGVWR